jgi:RNA polymerase sigma-70 factor (ECF subfamily)
MERVDLGWDWAVEESVAASRRQPSTVPSAITGDRPMEDGGTRLPVQWSKNGKGDGQMVGVSGADPDQEVVAACRAGDRQAFNLLVLRHQDRVYTLAVRLLGDRGEAEDMAQEAFLKAYERVGDFRGDAKFRTWLYRICYNLCLNLLERKKSDPADGPPHESIPDPGARMPEQLIEKERRELINRALSSLQREFREVIVLYHTGQWSYDEIAGLLALPVGTVRSRLHRARAELKQLLRPYLQED